MTTLGDQFAGVVLVTGSHGGAIAGRFASAAGVAGVIFNDAGGGFDDAGIASLAMFDRHYLPAATVSHMSARIGDARDCFARGIISHANRSARNLGVAVGQPCPSAAALLRASRAQWHGAPIQEARFAFGHIAGSDIWGLDSAALACPEDAGRILIIGSHGGLPGRDAARALKVAARVAIFNDAGVGIDDAGIARLPALDARGIAAATVDAWTARIGDARSVWRSGVISHLNHTAMRMGGEAGQTAQDFARIMAHSIELTKAGRGVIHA
ncbi:hypothetical protein [Sphingomonas vulcanisoli]|uniref:hypothetical protein n=1 Tax=Sphingomonas vulcanisoli TaxID=1658060 RepID=UPI001ABA7454|nr:hypothetical protein [Sphingomonas vulcanisoli]